MNQKNNNTGFTLLEVIVSLVILTIALTAIISVGSNRAETLIELRERNRALLVANNVLEQYTKERSLSTGVIEGKQENGNIDWYWQISVSVTNNDNIYRLDIKVSKDNDFDYALAQLVGFTWH